MVASRAWRKIGERRRRREEEEETHTSGGGSQPERKRKRVFVRRENEGFGPRFHIYRFHHKLGPSWAYGLSSTRTPLIWVLGSHLGSNNPFIGLNHPFSMTHWRQPKIVFYTKAHKVSSYHIKMIQWLRSLQKRSLFKMIINET